MSSVAASPFRRFVPFALLLALAACQEAPRKNTFRYVAPTAAQAEEFAKSFELALTNRNAHRMTRLIGWDQLIEKATSDVEASAQFRRDFIKGAKQSIATDSFSRQLIGIVEKGGSIERLHFRTVDGETRLVLRILLPDAGGVNYHEMTLHRDASGFVQASDIYVYTAAEPLSETFARNFRLAASQQQRSRVLARLVTGEKPSVTATDYSNLTKMAEAARKGEDDRTLELYRKLPAKLRNDKMAMMFYLQASSNKGNEAYGKALADFRATHGREKGVDLILIDALLLQKKYAEALASIDRVDAAVGGDPYLDVMRANVLLTSGDVEKAKAAARRAVERDPALPEAYWSLLSISLTQNDHAETTRLLETVRDQLEIELADLTTLPDYARYVQTVEYAQFMRSGTEQLQ